MKQRTWNQMTCEARYDLLRTLYPDCLMANKMAVSKWLQLPSAVRAILERMPQ